MTLSLLLLAVLPCTAQTAYTIEDIGTVSATPSDPVHAKDINNRGHVLVRNQRTLPGTVFWQDRAVFWDGQVSTMIVPSVSGTTWPGGMNDDDICVGQDTVGAGKWHGFVWDPVGGMTHHHDLGLFDFTFHRAVNAHGILGGDFTSDESYNFVFQNHAFLAKKDGQYLDLESLSQSRSFFKDLNDLEQVVGTSGGIGGGNHGFLWTEAGGMVDIGNLGGNLCTPLAINNAGVIVGRSTDSLGQLRPFVRTSAGMADLGPLPGDTEADAIGLNEHGTIVGASGFFGSGATRATRWKGGQARDLNTLIPAGSGWTLRSAVSINELGEIVGTGDYQGNTRAYRLQPVLSAPRLSGFLPALAGEDNRMYGLGFTPGAAVEVYWGLASGSTAHACGVVLGIDQARLAFTATADAEGRIEVPSWLPPHAAGTRPYFQAVEPASCVLGELRQQRIH